MPKRCVYLIFWVLVLAGVFVVVCSSREREPEYGGKRLSEWVDRYSGEFGDLTWEADRAIRQIGTNGIPCLLKWLGYETPTWNRKLNRIISSFNASWQIADKREVRAQNAMQAFYALGREGAGAVAQLTRLADEHPVKTRSVRASWVLDYVRKRNPEVSFSVLGSEVSLQGPATNALGQIEPAAPKSSVP